MNREQERNFRLEISAELLKKEMARRDAEEPMMARTPPPTAAAQVDTTGWSTMTIGPRPSEKEVDAGCAVLYEKVAEAFEPEWRDIVRRVYLAMREV